MLIDWFLPAAALKLLVPTDDCMWPQYCQIGNRSLPDANVIHQVEAYVIPKSWTCEWVVDHSSASLSIIISFTENGMHLELFCWAPNSCSSLTSSSPSSSGFYKIIQMPRSSHVLLRVSFQPVFDTALNTDRLNQCTGLLLVDWVCGAMQNPQGEVEPVTIGNGSRWQDRYEDLVEPSILSLLYTHIAWQTYVRVQGCKSNSTVAQYVSLQIKLGWRTVETCWFGSAKWFWPSIFAQFAEAGKRHIKA
jgi:hypothetical protein